MKISTALPKKRSKKETNLYNLRKEKGKTQEQIADEIGCTAKTYTGYESGKSLEGRVDLAPLLKLREMFGVSMDHILNLTEYKTPGKDYIGRVTGLSDDAIEMLKILNSGNNNGSASDNNSKQCLAALNLILGDSYNMIKNEEKKTQALIDSHSLYNHPIALFVWIYRYLQSDNYVYDRDHSQSHMLAVHVEDDYTSPAFLLNLTKLVPEHYKNMIIKILDNMKDIDES